MSAVMPGQWIYVFNEGLFPRQVLGREALALQGFPINRLDEPEVREFIQEMEHKEIASTDRLFGDIAGSMVATPVMLAIVMSTLMAVSWVEPPKIVAEVAEQPAPNMPQNLPQSLPQNFPFQPEDPPLQKHGGVLSRILTAPRHKRIRT